MGGALGVGMHAMLFGLKRGYYGALRYARRTLGAFGVTPARFDLMFALRENGWHLQSELRRILGVAGPTVSRMLKSLEGLGLVGRERSPHDGREKVVWLTKEGEKRVEGAAAGMMGSGCADVAMARAVMGEATAGWTFRKGLAGVVRMEEALIKVRRGFGDGAQLLYTHCAYAMGWRSWRKKNEEIYDPSLTDEPFADVVEAPPVWPGIGEKRDRKQPEEWVFGKILRRPRVREESEEHS